MITKKPETKHAEKVIHIPEGKYNHAQMAELLKSIHVTDTHHASERARLLAEYEAETKPKK